MGKSVSTMRPAVERSSTSICPRPIIWHSGRPKSRLAAIPRRSLRGTKTGRRWRAKARLPADPDATLQAFVDADKALKIDVGISADIERERYQKFILLTAKAARP